MDKMFEIVIKILHWI